MDTSYRRYRQYRANRYQYKVDQVTAPIVMMFIIGFITDYWWVIIAGVAILFLTRISRNNKRNAVERIVDSMGDASAKQEKEISFQKEEVRTMSTTEVGYINKNNQRNNGRTDKPGTDFGQWFYDMECLDCGHKYHANGHDVWLRKCPKCQGGRP